MLRRIHLRRRAGGGGRRRLAAGLSLLVAIGVIVAIVLVTQSSTSPGSASASTQASGATTVQRRNLVATDTESGTLSYNNPQTVYNRLSGTITWLPSVGQVIRQGQALFKVDQEPVVLMNGSTPAYRDLDASATAGPDILELNRDLIALGYTSEGIIADDEWQAATTDAVEVFQESLGETATGILTLGQVVFLPGSQVVSTVSATIGSDGGGGGSGGASTALRLDAPAPEFVSLTTRTTQSQTSNAPSQPSSNGGHHGHKTGSSSADTIAALIALLKAESAQLKAESAQLKAASHGTGGSKGGGGSKGSGSGKSSGSGSSSGSGGSGSSGGGGGSSGGGSSGGGTATAVLQTASTQLVATVDLDPSKQSEAKVGEKVTVEMPAGNTVNGTVSAVSPIAQASSNSGSGGSGSGGSGGGGSGNGNGSSTTSIPVTITLSGHQSGAGLDQAAVSVNFVQSEANNVLSVPVTALLATAGGGYAVQEAVAPHKLVPVTTGLFAAGYVQISGPGVYQGLQVTDSQG